MDEVSSHVWLRVTRVLVAADFLVLVQGSAHGAQPGEGGSSEGRSGAQAGAGGPEGGEQAARAAGTYAIYTPMTGLIACYAISRRTCLLFPALHLWRSLYTFVMDETVGDKVFTPPASIPGCASLIELKR